MLNQSIANAWKTRLLSNISFIRINLLLSCSEAGITTAVFCDMLNYNKLPYLIFVFFVNHFIHLYIAVYFCFVFYVIVYFYNIV